MIRAHQPGSQPIDIPEAIPNPAVPQPVPAPSETPKEPVKAPAPQNAMSRNIDRANGESSPYVQPTGERTRVVIANVP